MSPAHARVYSRRIAARPARDRIARHLQARYGIAVSGLAELDLSVYRVDRADGPAWVARVFPAARAQSAAAGDAEIFEMGQLRWHLSGCALRTQMGCSEAR